MLAQVESEKYWQSRVLAEWGVLAEWRVLAERKVLAEQIILNLTMFMHLLFLDSLNGKHVKHPFKLIFV